MAGRVCRGPYAVGAGHGGLESQQYRTHATLYEVGLNTGVTCPIFAALALWILGYPDQAQQYVQKALTLAQELPDLINRAFALCFAALLQQFRREEGGNPRSGKDCGGPLD